MSGFWSSNLAEPKRKFRWKIIFTGGQLSGLQYALKKADKPKGKVNPTTHKYLNHNFNYPGRWEWEDINMTFASVTRPDATRLINTVLINAGYGFPETDGSVNTNHLATIGKRKFSAALGNSFELVQLNPDGVVIERWNVYNPFFTSVNYGDLDYSSEDIVDIQVGVKYDYAKLAGLTEVDDGITAIGPGFPNSGAGGAGGGTPPA